MPTINEMMQGRNQEDFYIYIYDCEEFILINDHTDYGFNMFILLLLMNGN